MHQKTIKRGNWFEIYDGPCFTLARRLPARFDISREISMPLMSAPRLARQIRQDIWRKLVSRAFASLRGKQLKNPWKKHDNIPL